MRIEQLVPAEAGWKAVFKEPDGGESLSRVLCWASVGADDESALVGMIVDPADPARIVAASAAASPGGGAFARYRYIAPEPTLTVTPAPAPAPPATQDTAEKLAKSFLKRGR
jgi:hypothetical protein